MASPRTLRSPIDVTLSVWKALFLRDAVSRLSLRRMAWLWLLAEPALQFAFVMFVFIAIRMRVVVGIDTAVWIMVGLLAYFIFRRAALGAMNAVRRGQVLFTYRQIKPVDIVIVSAALEGFLMTVVAAMVLIASAIYGLDVVPADPLLVVEAFFAMWLLALGFGLCASVVSELVPELGTLIRIAMPALYIFSGVIFPLELIPRIYREWLMLNPLAHGLEAARHAFSPHYRVAPETSVVYMYGFALVAIFFGLALHRRFSTRLVMQ